MEGNKVLVDFWGQKRSNSSKIWDFYGFYKEDGVVNKAEAVCKICSVKLKYTGSTSNLLYHLNNCHPKFLGILKLILGKNNQNSLVFLILGQKSLIHLNHPKRKNCTKKLQNL